MMPGSCNTVADVQVDGSLNQQQGPHPALQEKFPWDDILLCSVSADSANLFFVGHCVV